MDVKFGYWRYYTKSNALKKIEWEFYKCSREGEKIVTAMSGSSFQKIGQKKC